MKKNIVRFPITVLFLDHAQTEISGAEFSLFYLVTNLSPVRYLPIVACMRNSPLWKVLSDKQIKLLNFKFPDVQKNSSVFLGIKIPNPFLLIKNIYELWACSIRLARHIRRENVDIVHINTMLPRLPGLIAAKLGKIKVIWHVRDFVIQRSWLRIYDWLSRFVDRIITVSDACQAQFSHNKNLVTIYNGVDLNIFKFDRRLRGKFRRELGLNDSDIVIGNIGLLAKRKGLEVFLDAAQIALQRHQNLKFVVVGDDFSTDGSYRKTLVKKARNLGIEEYVSFTGFKTNVVEVLSDLDIGVVSSVRPDPFPRMVIEMMAAGVPVIASNIGGIPEAILNGVTGFLVTPGNSEELAEKIILLVENRDLRKRMGERAREIARDRFSIQQNVRRIQEVYTSLVAT